MEISLWSQYAPRHQLPTKLQGYVDKEKKLTNNNTKRKNANRVEYDYKVGHYAVILRDRNYRKLEGEKLEPFRITQVHTNGSDRIRRGIVNDIINIPPLTPHFGDPVT